ncbi:MAG: ArsR family transcriptional regulator [Candidatus Bathyarchaeota archaeon]|nr:ArsR family transcriptional regulator [Candidatus Bathyarchaeota archaeon]
MSEKSQAEIDTLLTIVQNPIRRKIIRRLSQEASYPLEIAKEIGVGQQLVTTHLALMEREGFVQSNMESSPLGPNRRLYFLKQSAYLTVCFGPHLYDEKYFTFEALPNKLSKDAIDFLGRIDKIQEKKPSNSIEPWADLIADIDKKMAILDDEKAVLLYIRNLAMKQANKALHLEKTTHDERRILQYILDEQTINIENISQTLNLRESLVREILAKLKREHPKLSQLNT